MKNFNAVFIPCFINKIEPETGIKAIEILKKFNINFIIPEKQTCCGQPFFNSGYIKATVPFAKNFLKNFSNLNVEKIIFLSSSCFGFVKNYYEEIGLNSKYLKKFLEIKEKIIDFYKFLEMIIPEDFNFKRDEKKVYLHPSCHLLREAKVYNYVKKLLLKIKGIELIEEDIPFCCGFGGTFSIKEPEISTEMAKRKFNLVKEKNPDLLLIPDTPCFIHLKSYKQKNNIDLPVLNLIDYLYEKIL